jgi:glycosyltransferase involved in cell wall biosynthesis
LDSESTKVDLSKFLIFDNGINMEYKDINVLIYWHDMYLPYSQYLIEEFDKNPIFKNVIIAGPENIKADAIFSVPTFSKYVYKKTEFILFKTYKYRPKFATIKSFYKAIKYNNPDLIIVLDEAMSLNVFNAGLANYLARNKAKVVFYGFDNIPHTLPWKYLIEKFNTKTLITFLKRAFRLYFFNYGFQILRKRIIHGGLTCYSECTNIITQFGWNICIEEQWWGLPLNKYFNGVKDEDNIKIREQLNISIDAKLIGYVGRFVEEKGVLDLLNAFGGLNNKFFLLLIGDGYLLEEIIKYAEKNELIDRVRVISPKSQNILSAYYRAMDVLVLPSKTDYFWKEQFGRVLVEAQACGTSVVGSTSGAIPFVIGDENFCFEEGDIEGMRRVINKSITSSKDVVNARIQSVQKAEVGTFINSFIALYIRIREMR